MPKQKKKKKPFPLSGIWSNGDRNDKRDPRRPPTPATRKRNDSVFTEQDPLLHGISNDSSLNDDRNGTTTKEEDSNENSSQDKLSIPRKERLVSLDAFRGTTIAFMIFVNKSTGTFDFIEHAHWNGLHVADFVMPFFLFIVGISIALSISSLIDKKIKKWEIFKKIIKRTLKLFALGLFLQGSKFPNYDLSTLRIMGVLQRIAFDYFIVSLGFSFCPKFNIKYFNDDNDDLYLDLPFIHRAPVKRWLRHFRIMIEYSVLWITPIVVLSLYLGLVLGLYVPECGRGHLGPSCNAVGYIDSKILTPDHMYQHPTCKKSNPPCPYFDPEGLLSTLASSLSTFIGLYYGFVIVYFSRPIDRLLHWTVVSLPLILLSLPIALSGAMPYNKNLYSISYVLLTAGIAGFVFAAFYLFIDIIPAWLQDHAASRNWSAIAQSRIHALATSLRWTVMPGVVLGMNSIAIYFGDGFLPLIIGLRGEHGTAWVYWKDPANNLDNWLYDHVFRGNGKVDERWAALLWGITDVVFWIGIGFVLYWRKIFIKI